MVNPQSISPPEDGWHHRRQGQVAHLDLGGRLDPGELPEDPGEIVHLDPAQKAEGEAPGLLAGQALAAAENLLVGQQQGLHHPEAGVAAFGQFHHPRGSEEEPAPHGPLQFRDPVAQRRLGQVELRSGFGEVEAPGQYQEGLEAAEVRQDIRLSPPLSRSRRPACC